MNNKYHVREANYLEWISNWTNIEEANFLQSWGYGDARSFGTRWKPFRFVVSSVDDERVIALVQFMVWKVPLLGGIAHLNRGPLLVNRAGSEGQDEIYIDVLERLLNESFRRRWWFVQVIPEIFGSPKSLSLLSGIGLRPLNSGAWGSSRVDLFYREDEIRSSFEGVWRNQLKKAEKSGIEIKNCSHTIEGCAQLVAKYEKFKTKKLFDGISGNLLENLLKSRATDCETKYFRATVTAENGDVVDVGHLVAVFSGDTATYLVGLSEDAGRSIQANSILLWFAIQAAKNSGLRWFDLGGLGPTTPKSIANFKRGLGGEEFELSGAWIFSCLNPLSRRRKVQ